MYQTASLQWNCQNLVNGKIDRGSPVTAFCGTCSAGQFVSVVCSVLIQRMVRGDVPVYAVGVWRQAVGEAGMGSLPAAARLGDEGAVVRGAGGAQRLPRGGRGCVGR